MRSSTTFSADAPGRAAAHGRVAAATRWARTIGPEARRQATAKAREARARRRLDRIRDTAVELGFSALTPAELADLERALEAERIARLQLSSVEAARARRGARSLVRARHSGITPDLFDGDRDAKLAAMVAAGLSMSEAGAFFGLSRQRVHQLLHPTLLTKAQLLNEALAALVNSTVETVMYSQEGNQS
jgi:hypothetical protein